MSIATRTGKGVGRTSAAAAAAECPILDQMTERAKVLIGEINAANTSLNLCNELSLIM